MTAYYNEHDPFAAAWLRELIKDGLIAPGEVDERNVEDVTGADLRGFAQVHLFAGIGGWSYALRLAGWPDERPVWTGSCPCQPFSAAGKRKGTSDPRHLWPEFRRLISECEPAIVFGEQVASKDGRLWLAGVRADLEALGYAVGGADLCAAGVGAPHIRQRLWWVADAYGWLSGYGELQPGGQHGQLAEDRGVGERMAYSSSSDGRVESPTDLCRREPIATWCSEADGLDFSEGQQYDGSRPAPHIRQRLWWVADAQCSEWRSQTEERNDINRSNTGRQETAGWNGANSAACNGLVDAERNSRNPWWTSDEPGESTGASPAGPRPEPGRRCVFVPCLDGKARRVEPTIQPLAHGVSNRVGLLRGAGNAIVPQVAAEFIRASLTK